LNEAWLYIGKAATTDGDGIDYGYRFDGFWGTSARLDTSAGLESNINRSQAFYGIACRTCTSKVPSTI